MLRVAAAIAVLAAGALAQTTANTCTPELLNQVLACHADTATPLTIPTGPFWQNDVTLSPALPCCAPLMETRQACNVGEFFASYAAANFNTDQQRTLIGYLLSCPHFSEAECRTASEAMYTCIGSATSATTGECCDAVAERNDRCVHYDVYFAGETREASDRPAVELAASLAVDTSPGTVGHAYLEEENVCFTLGEPACTSTRRAAVNCALSSNVVAGEPWQPTPCCWLAELAVGFCKDEQPDDAFLTANGVPAADLPSLRSLFSECVRKDGGHDCSRVIPDVYMVQGNMIAPCAHGNVGGFFMTIHGRDYCHKAIPNSHAVPECEAHHGHTGSDSGSNDGSAPM